MSLSTPPTPSDDDEAVRERAARRAELDRKRAEQAARDKREEEERLAARRARQLQREAEKASSESAEKAQMESIQANGQLLLKLAEQLGYGPEVPADTQAWLEKYAESGFEASVTGWNLAKSDASLFLRGTDNALRTKVDAALSGVRLRKSNVETAERKRLQRVDEASGRKARLAQRELEARQRGKVPDTYIELEIKTEGLDKTEELSLLLLWIFGTAFDRLLRHGDRRIIALLNKLSKFRSEENKASRKEEDEKSEQKDERILLGGPYVEFLGTAGVGVGVGKVRPNAVYVTIGLSAAAPAALLTSDDPRHEEQLAGLVTEVAKTFIHETAHLWQLRTYDNDSHPWENPGSGAPGDLGPDRGIRFDDWPGEVRDAYLEFDQGGVTRQAAANSEWLRLKKVLRSGEYYQEPSKDLRGREFVSHLIELLYVWNEPDKFDRIFPKCAGLLKRVIPQ